MSYASAIKSAIKQVNAKGKLITITRAVTSEYIPGATQTSADLVQTPKAVVLPADKVDISFKIDTLEYKELSYILMAKLDWQLLPGDKVTIASVVWTIIGAKPTNPNVGDPIIVEAWLYR